MMTLKEFTKEYLDPRDAYMSGNQPKWRKAFPTNLRTIKKLKVLKSRSFFSDAITAYETIVQEQWVRVHAGEIIDTEWRELYNHYTELEPDDYIR